MLKNTFLMAGITLFSFTASKARSVVSLEKLDLGMATEGQGKAGVNSLLINSFHSNNKITI